VTTINAFPCSDVECICATHPLGDQPGYFRGPGELTRKGHPSFLAALDAMFKRRENWHTPPEGAKWTFPDLRYRARERVETPLGNLLVPSNLVHLWNQYGWPDLEQLEVMACERYWA